MSETAAERARAHRLKTLFNLTPEEYDEILAYQDGRCAVCDRLPAKARLAVDHDHKTGLVRGLLCWTCNARVIRHYRGIEGHDLLHAAATYLIAPPATEALGREVFGVLGRTTNKKNTRKLAERKRLPRKQNSSKGASLV